ncbi:hypothetical protein SESBI_38566 [Sesbania bispinosa]|nr:hypothetical protein SESBI_38566 [Sesbania bispinosa]
MNDVGERWLETEIRTIDLKEREDGRGQQWTGGTAAPQQRIEFVERERGNRERKVWNPKVLRLNV